MKKVLSFDEFMNESYVFHSYGEPVEEIQYYDTATEVFESEINSFLGIEEEVFEATKALNKEEVQKAFEYVRKPEELNNIKTELKTGSKGDDVKKLQSLMGVVTDGIFGPETRGGLKKWQQISGIKVDGIFKPSDAEKYVKAIKASNVEKASKEASKIAKVAFDPKDPIVMKGIEEVKIIKVGDKTYVIITPAKNVAEVAKEAKAKGSKGYEFLMGLAGVGYFPLALVGKDLYKLSKDVVKGMVGALTTLGEKTYELSCNVWAGILKFGNHIKEEGKESWKKTINAGVDFHNVFVKACTTAAKKAKDVAIATAALFAYFYDQSKKAFKSVSNFLSEVVAKSYKGLTVANQKIGDNIKTAYSSTVDFLKKSADKTKSFLKSSAETAKNLAVKTGEIAINTANKIGGAAVEIGAKIVNKSTKFVDDINMAFYNLLFESQEMEGNKSIFESYSTLENGEKFYVPTWRLITE